MNPQPDGPASSGSAGTDTVGTGTAARYRRFADVEARGSSGVYEEWARAIADDAELLALIDRLPVGKRQPNLVFAAARWCGVPVGGWTDARRALVADWPTVEAVAMERATQTNEPRRSAQLLLALARIRRPIALIEVGASAGLCLQLDRYAYRYADPDGAMLQALDPAAASELLLDCTLDGVAPPDRIPDVVWRAGIDLNPLDPADPDDLAWLDALVWPGHEERRERLRIAARIASRNPAPIVRGDLVARLPEVVATARGAAPPDAVVVVMHSAVLAYLPRDAREAFRRAIDRQGVAWVSNEGRGVFPDIDERMPVTGPVADFTLALDGAPIAITEPHGARAWTPTPDRAVARHGHDGRSPATPVP